MKAGRELDALVAERVMGWTKTIVDNYPWQILPPDATELKAKSCPHYSTDIAAAWQVVEKLRQDRLYIEIVSEAEYFRCEVNHYTPAAYQFKTEQHADTAPLAICLAALEAVRTDGAEQEGG